MREGYFPPPFFLAFSCILMIMSFFYDDVFFFWLFPVFFFSPSKEGKTIARIAHFCFLFLGRFFFFLLRESSYLETVVSYSAVQRMGLSRRYCSIACLRRSGCSWVTGMCFLYVYLLYASVTQILTSHCPNVFFCFRSLKMRLCRIVCLDTK